MPLHAIVHLSKVGLRYTSVGSKLRFVSVCFLCFTISLLWLLFTCLALLSLQFLQNLSQLASINYDLLSKGWKDDPPPNSGA